MKKENIKKVIIITEKSMYTLTGEECNEWIKDIERMEILSKLRGSEPYKKDYNWKSVNIRKLKIQRIIND